MAGGWPCAVAEGVPTRVAPSVAVTGGGWVSCESTVESPAHRFGSGPGGRVRSPKNIQSHYRSLLFSRRNEKTTGKGRGRNPPPFPVAAGEKNKGKRPAGGSGARSGR